MIVRTAMQRGKQNHQEFIVFDSAQTYPVGGTKVKVLGDLLYHRSFGNKGNDFRRTYMMSKTCITRDSYIMRIGGVKWLGQGYE